ncbi:fimbria/pilus outer membrane usher protein [Myxococcus sp. Y35]|uniref:fimbria/pilus outer membrane usher protein n=1 Tax=Pseudomyxococcus flavus TaxID=3115648 RepID=UPI003CE801E1
MALALWLAASSAVAEEAASMERLVLALEVNGVDRGEVFPVRRDGLLLIDTRELLDAGILVAMLPGRREQLDGRTYLAVDEAAPELRYSLDEQAALLRLTASLAALPMTQVDLRAGTRPTDLEISRPASAFLNYAARLRGTELALTADAGWSLRGLLLTSTATWAPGGAPVRGLTQLTRDEPSRVRRWMAGDAIVSTGPLGGGAVLTGLHVSREFRLDPYGLFVPGAHVTDGVTTPSTLEVYVNDVLVRTLDLPPGPFSMQDLPLTRGATDARYVLRDAFGRTREVTQRFYLASGLLAPGMSDFALSAGFRRENLATKSFDYGPPALLGRYRRGLGPRLTAGGRWEAALDRVSAGPELACRLPVGELSLALSGSLVGPRAGATGQLQYAYLERRLGIGLFARGTTDHYATVSLDPEDERPLLEAGGSVSMALGRAGSLGVQATALRWRDQGVSFRATALGSLQLTRALTLSLSASRAAGIARSAAWEGLLSLSVLVGERTSARLWRQQGPGPGATAMDVVRTPPLGGGLGYRVQAQHGPRSQGDARVEYAGAIGRAAAGAGWRDGVFTPQAEFSGALVAMDGVVLPTRSVEQGFALVRVPGADGVRVLLNQQDIGRTNTSGAVVVPGLLPYYANRVSIAQEDLPPGFDVPEVERAIAPVFRGGALVRFNARRFRAVRGSVVIDEASGATVPSFGELSVALGAPSRQERRSPLGRDGEFELEDLEPGYYRATVHSEAGTCVFVLTVPSQADGITEVGRQRCQR